ncbi:hypothetical protein [Shewanella sp. 0m-4]
MRTFKLQKFFILLIATNFLGLTGCAGYEPLESQTTESAIQQQNWVVQQQQNFTVRAINRTKRDNGNKVLVELENYFDGRHSVRLTESKGSCIDNIPISKSHESIMLIGNDYIHTIRNDICVGGMFYGEYIFSSGFSDVEDQKLNLVTYALFSGLDIDGVIFGSNDIKQVISAFKESNRIISSVTKI